MSDFMISLKLFGVSLSSVGNRWNLAKRVRRSCVVGNDKEATGRAEKDENASKADVGGGFAIERLVYKRKSTEVYAGILRGSSVFLTLSWNQLGGVMSTHKIRKAGFEILEVEEKCFVGRDNLLKVFEFDG